MRTRLTSISLPVAGCLALLFTQLFAAKGWAATITVTSTADSGPGTLRAALATAADGDTIDATGISGTILLTSGELLVDKSVSILGPGASSLAVDGNATGYSRVFHVGSNTVVTIASLTITNAFGFTSGAGILNDNATLTVSNCTLSGNRAYIGGGAGILNLGYFGTATAVIVNSTLSGNIANGSAIENDGRRGSASMDIVNCTVSGNTGGLFNPFGAVVVLNSTFFSNGAIDIVNGIVTGSRAELTIGSSILAGGLLHLSGRFTSLGYSITVDDSVGLFTNVTDQVADPLLGPLQDNGGPTFTHALLPCSPALDAGHNFSNLATDQRGAGFARTFDDPAVPNAAGGDGTDIGAFEVQTSVAPPVLSALGPAKVWLGLKNSDDVGTKFDLLAEVLVDGTVVSSNQLNNVPSGSSGFNNAVLRTINQSLGGAVAICPGQQVSIRLSVRIAVGVSGHRSGTARLWFNDIAANSRFDATINGAPVSYYLRDGFVLSTSPGPGPKKMIDVFVDRLVNGNPFKPFGTWNIPL